MEDFLLRQSQEYFKNKLTYLGMTPLKGRGGVVANRSIYFY